MKRELLANIIPSLIACFIISFAVGGYVIPFPESGLGNAVNNGVSGLFSGGISALIVTLVMYRKHRLKK